MYLKSSSAQRINSYIQTLETHAQQRHEAFVNFRRRIEDADRGRDGWKQHLEQEIIHLQEQVERVNEDLVPINGCPHTHTQTHTNTHTLSLSCMHAVICKHAQSAAIHVGGSHERLYMTGFVGLSAARLCRKHPSRLPSAAAGGVLCSPVDKHRYLTVPF